MEFNIVNDKLIVSYEDSELGIGGNAVAANMLYKYFEDTVLNDTLLISNTNYEQSLVGLDGFGTYYCVRIDVLEIPSEPSTILIKDKIFYIDGEIRLGIDNVGVDESYLDKSVIVTDYNILLENSSVSILKEQQYVSYYDLDTCLHKLQKQYLDATMKWCGKCDPNIAIQRDFFLSGISVLNYLLKMNNYTEADSLIQALSTCADNANTFCNCG